MRITCCKDCMDRYPGCHGKCEDYLEQKERLNNENELRRREKEAVRFRTERVEEFAGDVARVKLGKHPKNRVKK